MSKHTPGPWRAVDRGPFIATDHNTVIARTVNATADPALNCQCQTVADLEQCANAVLIAAAPDLLSTLQNLVLIFQTGNHYDTRNPYTRPEVKTALEAIAKATGFTGDWTDSNNDVLYYHNHEGEPTP
jgi:hypothetical protein